MKLKFILAGLLINSNCTYQNNAYDINISDKQLYDTMIPKELEEDCKKIDVNIRKVLNKNYDDEKIYQLIATNSMPKDVACFYLPAISFISSLTLMFLFSYAGVGHKNVKDKVTFTELFKFYFSLFIDVFLLLNIILTSLNITVYMLIQNYRFNLLYMIGIFVFIIPLITFFILITKGFLFSKNSKEATQEYEEKKNKIFHEKTLIDSTGDVNIHFDTKYIGCEMFLKILLIQIAYLVYFGYKISKVNNLQDKITSMKNNLNITKGVKKLNELQTEKIGTLDNNKKNINIHQNIAA